MNIKININLVDMQQQLDQVGKRVTKKLLRRALREAAIQVRDTARQNVPVRTGALKRSIVVETGSRNASNPNQVSAWIRIAKNSYSPALQLASSSRAKLRKVSSKTQKDRGRLSVRGEIYPRNYAHLVEFGTKPHAIGKGRHPGAKAQPFMGPAWQAWESRIPDIVRRRLQADLQAEIRQVAGSTRVVKRRVA